MQLLQKVDLFLNYSHYKFTFSILILMSDISACVNEKILQHRNLKELTKILNKMKF